MVGFYVYLDRWKKFKNSKSNGLTGMHLIDLSLGCFCTSPNFLIVTSVPEDHMLYVKHLACIYPSPAGY